MYSPIPYDCPHLVYMLAVFEAYLVHLVDKGRQLLVAQIIQTMTLEVVVDCFCARQLISQLQHFSGDLLELMVLPLFSTLQSCDQLGVNINDGADLPTSVECLSIALRQNCHKVLRPRGCILWKPFNEAAQAKNNLPVIRLAVHNG